jgi:dihydroflavonol-4-reductase
LKALVTGGTGFVGSHVARALADAGHSLRVLHRASSRRDALEGVAYESAIGDILDSDPLRAACAGCQWVFHVAAVADYWRADHARMLEANVEGTRRVLDAAREAGVQRVVFTSSAAAVGLRADGKPADESVAFNLRPERFPYGYSKVQAERVAQEAVQRGQEVVIVNPVVVMGPGDLNLISGNFIVQIRRLQWTVPVTSGGIGVVDVRDVARWHMLAVERGRGGERYLLGTANYALREWYAMIADTVGVAHPFLPLPGFVLPALAAGVDLLKGAGINLPVDADQTRLGAKNIFFDYHKAWRELGEPQIDMRQSLRDTYSWYQEHGYIKDDWLSRLLGRLGGRRSL